MKHYIRNITTGELNEFEKFYGNVEFNAEKSEEAYDLLIDEIDDEMRTSPEFWTDEFIYNGKKYAIAANGVLSSNGEYVIGEIIDLEQIAEGNNLTCIETTSERNGYPSNLEYAIIGFSTFEEAQKLADKYGLIIEFFERKEGQDLYYRTCKQAYEELKINACWYGDDFEDYDNNSGKDFFKDEVKDRLSEFDNFEDLDKFIYEKKEIYDAINRIDDNQLVLTNNGIFYSIIDQHSMSFYYDTKELVIGVISDI